MSAPIHAPARLSPIEGLRAYLALWVLFSHVMQWAGYPEEGLSGLWSWARQGFLPVKIFMIISGFVIMHRLEMKRETAGVFLLHRFFRIYPLYLLLFLVSVPVSAEWLWQGVPPALSIAKLEPAYLEWSANGVVHFVLHLFLLHGLVPETVAPAAQFAFLPPAWSIALEFQFYLLAPVIFHLLGRSGSRGRGTMYALCLLLLLVANRKLFVVLNPLSLPFFWSYFLVGIVTYYAYRHWRGSMSFALVALVALALLKVSDLSLGLFPICAWLLFLGLLVEQPASALSRAVVPLFDNRLVQYLGRISFSLYLSHWPVLALSHLALARLGWAGQGPAYLLLLLGVTLVLTLAVSAALYQWVEKPGIALGNKVAAKLFPARAVDPALVKAAS